MAFASSTQALLDNTYGQSKRAAEDAAALQPRLRRAGLHLPPDQRVRQMVPAQLQLGRRHLSATTSRATCPSPSTTRLAPLRLVYIDDVLDHFLSLLQRPEGGFVEIARTYETTVGELARPLRGFRATRESL